MMTKARGTRLIAATLVLGCGVLIAPMFGYIDPGTGSYVLQVAIAFLIGLAFSIKVFWKKIAAFLRKTFSGKKGAGSDVS